MTIQRAIAAIFLLGCLAFPLVAGTRKADGAIIDSRLQFVLDYAPNNTPGIPALLLTDRDVYLLIRAGGAYTEIVVIGRESVPPEKLIACLQAAVSGTPVGTGDTEWSSEPPYSVVRHTWQTRRLSTRPVMNTVQIGQMVTTYRNRGYRPHALLRIPTYARRLDGAVPPYTGKQYAWYNATDGRTVPIRAAIPLRALALMLLLAAAPIVSVVLAHRLYLRVREAPVAVTRGRLRTVLLVAPWLVLVGAQMAAFVTLLASGDMACISDVGLGRIDHKPLLIGCAILMSVTVLALLFAMRRLGLTVHAKKALDPTMSAEEQRLRARQSAWTEGLKMLAYAAVLGASFLANNGSNGKEIAKYIEYAVAFVAPVAVAAAFRKRLAPYERQTPDEDLTRRLQALIAGSGRIIRDVGIDEGLAGRKFLTVVRKKDSIVVARKAFDALSKDELDFLMVRAALAKGEDLSPGAVMAIILGIGSIVGWVLLLARQNGGSGPDAMWVWASYPTLVGVIGLYTLVRVLRGRAAEDDARALRLTRHYESAISALEKVVVARTDSKEDLKPVKLTRARIASLRLAAYEMGLPIPG